MTVKYKIVFVYNKEAISHKNKSNNFSALYWNRAVVYFDLT